MTNKIYTFILILVSLTICKVYSQDMRKVSYELFYTIPQNMTLERAKIEAAEDARVEAIAKEFGRTVSRSTTSISKKQGMEEVESFMSISDNDVKGEWIADIKKPEYSSFSTNAKTGETSFTVKVCGLASQITSQKIPLNIKLLCNGTEDRYEAYEFKSEDWLFVSAISPVKGYIAIFLLDNNQNIVCMLPYLNQSVGAIPVEANQKQIFFSYDDAPLNLKNYVIQYSMTCDGPEEINILYIVFSTDPFSKPSAENGIVPYITFNDWLSALYKDNKSVAIIKKPIIIKNR